MKPFLSPEASGFWFSINIEILHFSVWEELKSWGVSKIMVEEVSTIGLSWMACYDFWKWRIVEFSWDVGCSFTWMAYIGKLQSQWVGQERSHNLHWLCGRSSFIMRVWVSDLVGCHILGVSLFSVLPFIFLLVYLLNWRNSHPSFWILFTIYDTNLVSYIIKPSSKVMISASIAKQKPIRFKETHLDHCSW